MNTRDYYHELIDFADGSTVSCGITEARDADSALHDILHFAETVCGYRAQDLRLVLLVDVAACPQLAGLWEVKS